MENRETIFRIKELIKAWSLDQREDKLRRKSNGPNFNSMAQDRVFCRSLEITAALNFYHELRGKEHRHNVKEGCEYYYSAAINRLRSTQAECNIATQNLWAKARNRIKSPFELKKEIA